MRAQGREHAHSNARSFAKKEHEVVRTGLDDGQAMPEPNPRQSQTWFSVFGCFVVSGQAARTGSGEPMMRLCRLL
jgi:hypothetical protein